MIVPKKITAGPYSLPGFGNGVFGICSHEFVDKTKVPLLMFLLFRS
jgi:hypothetical protein